MRILFVGDVFGRSARDALLLWLPGFVDNNALDFRGATAAGNGSQEP